MCAEGKNYKSCNIIHGSEKIKCKISEFRKESVDSVTKSQAFVHTFQAHNRNVERAKTEIRR